MITDTDLAHEIELASGKTREALEELADRRAAEQAGKVPAESVRVHPWEGEPELVGIEIDCLRCKFPFTVPAGRPKVDGYDLAARCIYCSHLHTVEISLK